jgi:hypothetical protein
LVHGAAAHDGQHPVTLAHRVGQALQQHHADPLGEARTIGGVCERLAATVGCQAAQTRHADPSLRTAEHRDSAGQRQRALLRAQRRTGQVHSDERRRAGRVHRHRRSLQPEHVRHSSGCHAAKQARARVAFHARDRRSQPQSVIVVHQAHEHARLGAAQSGGIDARVFERLPRGFQQQPLLRICHQRLSRVEPEESRIELACVVEKAALARVRGSEVIGIGVVKVLQIPPAIGGELADPIATAGHHVPQILRRAHTAGIAAAHAHDRDR